MNERIELAGGVIQNTDKEILLLHRNTPALNHWEMPGGKVKLEEKPEAAACRELREELGVHVTRAKWLGESVFSAQGKDYKYQWYQTEVSGRPQIMEPDTFDELHFFPEYRLRRMMSVLSPNMLAFVKQLTDGEIRLES